MELLPQEVIIERLTGDGIAKDLMEPKWTIKKTIVTNEIDKLMVKEIRGKANMSNHVFLFLFQI